jgi:hypothetical protein
MKLPRKVPTTRKLSSSETRGPQIEKVREIVATFDVFTITYRPDGTDVMRQRTGYSRDDSLTNMSPREVAALRDALDAVLTEASAIEAEERR